MEGDVLRVHPAVVAPFAMDFDGDTASYTVPVSDKAVAEAIDKMMPEKNLLSAGTFGPQYTPSQEYTMGMYYASKEPKNKPVRVFATEKEAMDAYRKGDIEIDDPVIIKGR